MSYVNMDLELDGIKQRIKALEDWTKGIARLLELQSDVNIELEAKIKALEERTDSKADISNVSIKKVRNEHEAARYAAKKF